MVRAAAPGSPHVLPLVACAGQPPRRVGRKAAVLGWAARRGLAPPGGVVVAAERFREALRACGAADRARYLESAALSLAPRHVLDVAASIAEAMRSSAVDALAGDDAAVALARVGPGLVVCRSSSAMEDGRTAAFPGVFSSVLGIGTPAGLAAAVAACWRSAFSPDAMRYLIRLRAEPVDLSIAVMVQRQVEAAEFGVYVSADPLTGSPGAQADLGGAAPDAVMSRGRATVRSRRIGGRWVTAGGAEPAAAGLEDVHRAARRLRRHLACEVDLEFALPHRGEPVVLQCRPLTALGAGAAGAASRVTGPATADGPGVAVVEDLSASNHDVVFRARAVVTEQDVSVLSHVAVLCRELGVPLVCDGAGARERLIGRQVQVDGASGEVRVLDDGGTRCPPTAVAGPSARPDPETVVGAVELLLRVLADGRPGHPPAAEADRVARRCARATGARRVVVAPSSVGAADMERLERLGAALLGDGFSARAFLDGVTGRRLPAHG